jgi:hypothetical protein
LSGAPHSSESFSLNFLWYRFYRICDLLNNLIDFADDFIVPEPQHRVSQTTEELASTFVTIRLIRMLRSIELNVQLRLKTNEVRKKGSDRMLPAKLKSLHLMAAQTRP